MEENPFLLMVQELKTWSTWKSFQKRLLKGAKARKEAKLNHMYIEPKKIIEIAEGEGWIEIDHQENIYMLSFAKEFSRINVYYSKMTVATCLNHPKKGRTQMFRRNVSESFLKKIFKNPRVHTKKRDRSHGYRLKKHK